MSKRDYIFLMAGLGFVAVIWLMGASMADKARMEMCYDLDITGKPVVVDCE